MTIDNDPQGVVVRFSPWETQAAQSSAELFGLTLTQAGNRLHRQANVNFPEAIDDVATGAQQLSRSDTPQLEDLSQNLFISSGDAQEGQGEYQFEHLSDYIQQTAPEAENL